MTEQDVKEEVIEDVEQEDVETEENVQTEEHQVKGESLLSKIKELVHQGNIRRSAWRRWYGNRRRRWSRSSPASS